MHENLIAAHRRSIAERRDVRNGPIADLDRERMKTAAQTSGNQTTDSGGALLRPHE